ncbi:MAG: ABC-2 transporter permease, partial [Firmicutes bacterium]|nr:ABC-2 transporter permease [Bacillota bacterium]
MKNLKPLLKLDFQLLKPYWIWWVLFLGIALVVGLLNQMGFVFMVSLAMFAATIMAFPFESTDKSNLHVLFSTLPTNRRSMVLARYIFILIGLAVALVVGIVLAIVIDLIFTPQVSTLDPMYFLTSVSLFLALFTLVVGFQTPFFYRFGYVKGKIFMWVPIVLIMIAMMLPGLLSIFNIESSFNIFSAMFLNPLPTSLIALAFAIGGM